MDPRVAIAPARPHVCNEDQPPTVRVQSWFGRPAAAVAAHSPAPGPSQAETLPQHLSRARRRRDGRFRRGPIECGACLLTWAAQASLIPKDPDEGVTVVVAGPMTAPSVSNRTTGGPSRVPAALDADENTVTVEDRARCQQHGGLPPKTKRAKDDTWPVCNMCYEERCSRRRGGCACSIEGWY